MTNSQDLIEIKQALEPVKEYIAYNFESAYQNKPMHLGPPKNLAVLADEEENYKKQVLTKLKEIVNSNLQILIGNEKLIPDIYKDKSPINAKYIKSMLATAKKEITRKFVLSTLY